MGFLRRFAATFPHPPCSVIVFIGRQKLEAFFEEIKVAAFIPKICNPDNFIQKVKQVIAEYKDANLTIDPCRWRLMLIEDDEFQRQHLCKYFEQNGFDVHAIRGEEAHPEMASERNLDGILIRYLLSHSLCTESSSR